MTIEELNLPEQIDRKPHLKAYLLSFFTELLNKIHENPEVSNFLIHEKNVIFSEYFNEKTLENTRLLKKSKHQGHLSCGGDSLHEKSDLHSKNQVELLRNRLEILEKANEGLIHERAMQRKYEKELDLKLSELSMKTSMFFQHIEGKVKGKTLDFDRSYRGILGIIEMSLKEIIEDRMGAFNRELEYLKVVIKEKREDLKRVMGNEVLVRNEEVVMMEIDKSLKVMKEFMGNCMRRMIEEKREGEEKEKISVKDSRGEENCKACRIF